MVKNICTAGLYAWQTGNSAERQAGEKWTLVLKRSLLLPFPESQGSCRVSWDLRLTLEASASGSPGLGLGLVSTRNFQRHSLGGRAEGHRLLGGLGTLGTPQFAVLKCGSFKLPDVSLELTPKES